MTKYISLDNLSRYNEKIHESLQGKIVVNVYQKFGQDHFTSVIKKEEINKYIKRIYEEKINHIVLNMMDGNSDDYYMYQHAFVDLVYDDKNSPDSCYIGIMSYTPVYPFDDEDKIYNIQSMEYWGTWNPKTLEVNEDLEAEYVDFNVYSTEAIDEMTQGKLTAGENITIDENNVISATGGGNDCPVFYMEFETQIKTGNFTTILEQSDVEKLSNIITTCHKKGFRDFQIVYKLTNEFNNYKCGVFTRRQSGSREDPVETPTDISLISFIHPMNPTITPENPYSIECTVMSLLMTWNDDGEATVDRVKAVFGSELKLATVEYVTRNTQKKLIAGENINIAEDGTISALAGSTPYFILKTAENNSTVLDSTAHETLADILNYYLNSNDLPRVVLTNNNGGYFNALTVEITPGSTSVAYRFNMDYGYYYKNEDPIMGITTRQINSCYFTVYTTIAEYTAKKVTTTFSDEDLSIKAAIISIDKTLGFVPTDRISVLSTHNTSAYSPTLDYHPATKKYVDDEVASVDGKIVEKVNEKVTEMLPGYLEEKQDKLTAGKNITIDENNVISATGGGEGGGSYTAGDNIIISEDRTISAIQRPYYEIKGSSYYTNYIDLYDEGAKICKIINYYIKNNEVPIVVFSPIPKSYTNATTTPLVILDTSLYNNYVVINLIFEKLTIYSSVSKYGATYNEVKFNPKYQVYVSRAEYDEGKVTKVYSTIDLKTSSTVAPNYASNASMFVPNSDSNLPLSINNTQAYIPQSDYNPATKKYVDDLIASLTNGDEEEY